MIDKKQNRLRRARATRARIKDMKVNRLTVHRQTCTSMHRSSLLTVRMFSALLLRSNPKFVHN